MDVKKLKPKDLSSIPDPLATNEEKLTNAYGIKWARVIQQEWFNGGYIDKHSLFMERHRWIREMRLYNRGEQSVEKYKNIVARQEQDKSYLNLDWNPINFVEKFTNIVRNGISDEFYRLDIRSSDRFASLQREKNYWNHKKNMASRKMLEKAMALQGIDLMPKGFIPDDDEELSLYSEIKERPKQEIAEEILIDYVKEVSGWDQISYKYKKDVVESDLMAVRIYTDPINGVMAEYVDPESYGHSYVENNDFSDAFYHFWIDTITINDIRRESNLKDSDLRKIAKSYGSRNKRSQDIDYNKCSLNEILDFRIHVMRFCYKSDKEIVYKSYQDKKNRTRKVARRSSEYTVPEGAEKSRISKRFDTWYEGSYIVGSNEYIYNYKECENLERDDMDRALPPFVVQSTNIYKNKLKSFLSNIISPADQLQYIHLKIQHLISELKPDLIELDIDQLADLTSDTKGATKSDVWKTALSIINTKGVVLKKRINMGEDGIKDGASARPMANQQGSALTVLLNTWAHYYNLIRDITGINPARDGSLPADALLGVNKLMQLASNTATKHIVDAAVMFDKRVCETISARIKGVFSHPEANHIQKVYTNAVGKHNVEAIKTLKDRSLQEFGFNVQMVPSKEELDELKEDLGLALQEGTIDVSEKAEVMRIARNNFKQASEYMRFIRRRRIKEKMKEVEYNQKLQSQSNAEAAQVKQQGEIQTYSAKKQIDLQFLVNSTSIELQKKQAEQQLDAPVEDKKFDQQVYLEKVKNLQTINLTKYKEDEKSKREIKKDSRQSQMIEQRKKELGAFNFNKELDISEILA